MSSGHEMLAPLHSLPLSSSSTPEPPFFEKKELRTDVEYSSRFHSDIHFGFLPTRLLHKWLLPTFRQHLCIIQSGAIQNISFKERIHKVHILNVYIIIYKEARGSSQSICWTQARMKAIIHKRKSSTTHNMPKLLNAGRSLWRIMTLSRPWNSLFFLTRGK